jgi:hypothetical protein
LKARSSLTKRAQPCSRNSRFPSKILRRRFACARGSRQSCCRSVESLPRANHLSA